MSAPLGVGKTFLSIYLSKHFEAISAQQSEILSICFFCDNKIESRKTAVNILRGLMQQMIAIENNLVKVIMPTRGQTLSQLFERRSFENVWKVFEEMVEISSFRTIYCVIDALNECEHDSLSLLLNKFERLSDLGNRSPKKIKLVCLCRRFPERIPESLDQFTKIELDMMLAGRVSTLARKKKFSDKMTARVEEVFQRKSEGTFLWVSYMAQDLEHKNLLQIEKSLKSLPTGLDAIYDMILSEIDFSEERDTINRMLDWILIATRPLRIPELCEAAGVMKTEFLTQEEVCYELIKSCGHLLQVSRDESLFKDISVHGFDEDNLWIGAYEQEEAPLNELFWSPSVTFLHQSAKDYLGKRNNGSLGERDRHPLDKLHGSAATQLIQYFRDISRHPLMDRCQFCELTMELPLTLYATRSWHLHLREVQHDEEILLRNQRFFMDVSEPRRAYGALMRSIDWRFRSKFVREDLAPLILNLACFLGLQDLFRFCMTWACHRDADFIWEYTVDPHLHFAIRENNESIINILLDNDTDIVAAGSLAGNAFSLAIQ